jgi:hypothetical protein
MDDETRDALEMTKEELHARAVAGEPANVARFVIRDNRITGSSDGAIRIS